MGGRIIVRCETAQEAKLLSACDAYAGEVKTLARRIAELEAALAAIHATSRRVTHHHEWYLDGVRQSPGEYVVMRVGDAPDAPVTPF